MLTVCVRQKAFISFLSNRVMLVSHGCLFRIRWHLIPATYFAGAVCKDAKCELVKSCVGSLKWKREDRDEVRSRDLDKTKMEDDWIKIYIYKKEKDFLYLGYCYTQQKFKIQP